MRTRLALLIGMLSFASVADADESPWVKGVSAERRTTAQALLQEGNLLLIERSYLAALERYREAIKSWDHPAIRFNIVRCLIQLDRPVEAVDELELALAFGAAPLEEAIYTEALAYQKLLASQIASVALACAQQDVQVTLDGEPLATCPARVTRRVKPGRHQIVGDKPGHVPRTVSLVVVGGTEEPISLTLDPFAKAARIVHRFSTWLPWTVLGSGAIVAGIGGLVQLAANNSSDSYDRELARTCSAGCSGDQLANLRDLESRALLENRIAIGVVSVGVATMVTGGVLLFLNRGRTVYETSGVDVAPTRGGGVVTLRARF